MQINKIENKNLLNYFVSGSENSEFLQSWEWGEFQVKAGNKIYRVGIEENGEIIGAATLIKKPLFLGLNYFYCPRGPVIKDLGFKILDLGNNKNEFARSNKITDILFSEIFNLAKKEKAVFLRFEPKFKILNHKLKIINTIDIQPSKTIILDLSKSKDELLAAMHQKTRYNIRLAEKKGVQIIEAGLKQFDDFWQLMEATRDRDDYKLHAKDYYKTMLSRESNFIRLFLAIYKNKTVAAAVVSFFGDTAAYMHGASANFDRNVMAPFLLQWHIIKEAKNYGYKHYDLYGIDETKWPGVTRFKRGFGGQQKKYPGTFDLIFNPMWYNVYTFLRKIRRRII